jgi:hypothetical protein
MLLFAVALLAADPADQAAAPAQPAPAAEPAKPQKAKKICKADATASGSRMGKRLCLTEEEWAQRSSNGMVDSSRSGFSGKAEDH